MILIAEPDHEIAADILAAARHRGIPTQWCRDGGAALVLAGATQPDVLVVAARLPVLSASKVIDVVKNRWRMSILVGAGSDDDLHVQEALDAGAVARVGRPYDLDSVLALGVGTTASWAPAAPDRDADVGSDVLVAGPISVDVGRHEARIDGRELHFTHRELQLLVYLIRRDGRVADQAEITTAVWRQPVDTNTVAVHIKRLRDKLGDHPHHGQIIRTVRGAGYRLAPSLCTQPSPTPG